MLLLCSRLIISISPRLSFSVIAITNTPRKFGTSFSTCCPRFRPFGLIQGAAFFSFLFVILLLIGFMITTMLLSHGVISVGTGGASPREGLHLGSASILDFGVVID